MGTLCETHTTMTTMPITPAATAAGAFPPGQTSPEYK